jgi:hypothetical protein
MLLTLIFAGLAILLVAGSLSGHRSVQDPMVRVGARAFAAVLIVMAISFFFFTR